MFTTGNKMVKKSIIGGLIVIPINALGISIYDYTQGNSELRAGRR